MTSERLSNVMVIGDRALIKPKEANQRTKSGLYLPPGVQEKEKIQQGYVVKVGPGYALPPDEPLEPWEDSEDYDHFIPLQVQEGDLAIFVMNQAYQIMYEGEKYFIVPQNGILMVERNDDLFK